ncbi:type 1 glutamine amidotransferase domain-containing protein [Sphingobacterium olei]|uniref:Type 1 glutamine amidotransferase domain-containing protein n=1 Tax=Sphingobacterium olei TaxID=2571155 RepID=A0A4U0ND36_9SPHI|nr:type 1 glutamine amidotransferase domain-containing protein [Sphingobacterium olei]TJZ51422.1 type 1 glutamine amidotransferase domain-containing protein [Sphingobacterium olei]
METKNILMLLTAHRYMEDTQSETGVWLGEFTDPYYVFIDAGCKVTLVTIPGGEPPIDPMSKLTEHITTSNRRFLADKEAQFHFQNTLALQNIIADPFDGLFIPGGHGPLWDLARSLESGRLILEFHKQEKPIAALCHGPAAFLMAAKLDPSFLMGKKVTSFSNTEEALVARKNNIPYELETALRAKGAEFTSATLPFTAHVEIDGDLITGQNPLSASHTATALLERMVQKETSLGDF